MRFGPWLVCLWLAAMLATRQTEAQSSDCPKLEASPKASTALSLGECLLEQGLYASAWSAFGTAVTLAERENDTERSDRAKAQLAAVEEKLARITIGIGSNLEGIEVTLDGNRVVLGKPLPIDPGKHVVAAAAPGKVPWSQTIDVPPEKALIPITVGLLQNAVADPLPPAPDEAPEPMPQPEATSGGTSALVYAGLAIAGAGILVGGITGVVAIAQTSAIKENCNEDQCPASQSEAIDEAELIANVSNVSFAVGGVGLILVVVGLFLPTDSPEGTGLRLEPLIGPGVAGLRGRF